MISKTLQKEILDNHKLDDNSILRKYQQKSYGIAGADPVSTHTSLELVGLMNWAKHPYLPHFEYNVRTWYSFEVDFRFISETKMDKKGVTLTLKAANGQGVMDCLLPELDDFFYLRNLANDGILNSIVKGEPGSRFFLPAHAINSGFMFRASSTTYGQLVGKMDTCEPHAEEIIQQYLDIIDRRFGDYTTLKKHFQEQDVHGRLLYEDQNLQSRAYNKQRDKLHKALFGDLQKLLTENGLENKL